MPACWAPPHSIFSSCLECGGRNWWGAMGKGASGSWLQLLRRHQTVVKGPSGLPPVDRLLQFLVDSSGDGLEVVRCANCDLECGKQAGAPGVGARVPGPRVPVLADFAQHVLTGLIISGSSNSSLGSPESQTWSHFTNGETEVQGERLEPVAR